jgi:Transmembrane protein 43
MARKSTQKSISTSRIAVLVVIAVVAVLAALAWQYRRQLHSLTAMTTTPLAVPPQAAAPSGNPNADARPAAAESTIRVSGKLLIVKPPQDAKLGVTADGAVILFRKVEMYQWQEHCERDACVYEKDWSEHHAESSRFKSATGHRNPPVPFTDARFLAGEVRLDDLDIAPELIVEQHPLEDYPVRADALAPNMAATFNVVNGVLYAGGDAAHPEIGTLRIRYKIVPGGEIALSGVRRGSKLEAH